MPRDHLDVLISEQRLRERICQLADAIAKDHPTDPILLVGILKGSIHFLSDLARLIPGDTRVDFMQTSSYQDRKESSGNVQIRKDLDINIEGLHVIVVEDIVDTGHTLSHLRELLATRKPKSLKVVALLSKPEARRVHPPVEYLGFEIPNEFVVGYGLDYAERYRNLPYIAILREG
jgi:hypoxanthine phosphoribosyltransferase